VTLVVGSQGGKKHCNAVTVVAFGHTAMLSLVVFVCTQPPVTLVVHGHMVHKEKRNILTKMSTLSAEPSGHRVDLNEVLNH
jgi:nucleoside diphosphate kinase